MKIADTIIFSLSIVLTMIGIHQSMTIGFKESYVFYMFSLAMLFWYAYRKGKHIQETRKNDDNSDSGRRNTKS